MKDAYLQNQQPASAWLDVLSTIYPVTGALVIGAGTGNGPWVEWLYQKKVRPVWLLEGEQKQFQHLQRNFPSEEGWLLNQEIVVSGEDTSYFYQASNPWESSLVDPLLLNSVWPNLYSIHHELVSNGVTLKTLLKANTSSINWLIIDCLPAALLLENAKEEIGYLDMAVVRVLLDENPVSASLTQVDKILSNAGMRRLNILPERHPSLAYAIYVRNQSLQCAEMTKQIAHLHDQLVDSENKIESLRLDYELKLESVRSEVQQHEIQQLKKQCESQTKILLKIEALNENVQNKQQLCIEEITTRLDNLQVQSNNEQQLLKKIDLQIENTAAKRLEDQQHLISHNADEYEKQHLLIEKVLALINENLRKEEQRHKEWPAILKKELINRLGNTVRQVESFISIQNYLSTGDSIPSFHGWPISADIGLFLIEKIREEQYDVIIEFGSGTSTLLMAKALSALNITNHTGSKRIITFEHNEDYFLKTQKQLNINKVDHLVQLCLAPLKEWRDSSGNYRYYDCKETLGNLSKSLHGEKKKILVLVDGPPGDTCAHARYPAVPFLINLIKDHEIDWVLDDAYRTEEIGSANLWKGIWAENGIPFTDEIIKNEKGMYFSTTNR
ncbi:hypothetical protein C6560_20865 [Enterobacter sp. FS01]|nr:hypothetical protein C6560_20865 [Enterobacter sp. FS01]